MGGAASNAPLSPATRLHRWHVWLVVWRVHRWLAFAFGALLVLLSATGSLLVLHKEIERRVERERHVVTAPSLFNGAPPPLAELARDAAALAPAGYRAHRIVPASRSDSTHRFIFRDPVTAVRWIAFVNPWNGAVVWSGPEQSTFTPWVLGLHMQLHAGRAGYYVTAAAGVGLVALALSGLYIHRDRMSQLWRHPFRLGLGWRVALADLHKWIGIFALYFPVVLGITGTLYCLSILKAGPAAVSDRAFNLGALAPLEPMLVAAQEKLPGTEVLRAQLPSAEGGPVILLLLHREAPPWRKFSRVEFDAATGELKAVRAAADAPAATQFRAMLAPLHFGFYGASWVKWAYFVGGLSPAALALSGFALWWVRTRRRDSPAPILHRSTGS